MAEPSLVRSWPEVWAQSRSRDCHICRSRAEEEALSAAPEDCHAPYFEYHPSRRNSESRGEVVATEDANLEELTELGPEVTCFLRGSAENSEGGQDSALSQAQWKSYGSG